MEGKVVTVSQQKGGSGKTTLCSHLAVAWALGSGRRVAVLDVDPQGSLGEWFERREQRLGETGTHISFRTASGWGARRESRALAREHDLVVVDTPPHADRETRNAVELASLVVIPVQPTPADLWATEATLAIARGEGVPALAVLNRVPPRARLTAEIADGLAQLEFPVAGSRLGNRVVFAESLGAGLSAIELRRTGVAANEVRALAEELLRKLEPRRRAARRGASRLTA